MSILLLNSGVQGERVTKGYGYSWRVFEEASVEITLQWRLLESAFNSFEYRWKVQKYGGAYQFMNYRWKVWEGADREFSYSWKVGVFLTGKARHEFTVRPISERVYRGERIG